MEVAASGVMSDDEVRACVSEVAEDHHTRSSQRRRRALRAAINSSFQHLLDSFGKALSKPTWP